MNSISTNALGLRFRSESGSAILGAVFMLTVVGAIGVALLFLVVVEGRMGLGSLRAKQAFYLAEAGEEDARASLYDLNGAGDFTPHLQAAAGADGIFQFDPDALQVVYDAQGNPTALQGFGDDDPFRDITQFGDGWYAAFLTNDVTEVGPADVNKRIVLTGVGGGRNRSLEIVETLIERRETLPSLPPATITMLGPTPNFNGGNTNVHDYVGDDCGGSGQPGLSVPVVGAIGPVAEASAEAGISRPNGPNYESGGLVDEDVFADLLDDVNEPTVDQRVDDGWTDCQAMHEMIEEMRELANVVCCNPPVCNPAFACVLPPVNIANLIFIDGDYTVGPAGGEGTLVVTGELTYNGRASWRGMIFAVGEGVFRDSGAGNGTISGAVVVADIAGPDDIYGTADDCTGGDNGFDAALFDQSGGGNASTVYCTADIIGSKPKPPYKILSFRQR